MICRLKLFQRQIRSFSTVLPRLVDSVSGELKVIQQTGKTLSWYSCGPTVYDSSHVGHARTYVQIDLLQRILSRRFGMNIHSAMGITNIDDKIINKSRQTMIPWQEIASRYEEEFINDMQRLNVKMPMSVVRVSDMIPEIVDYIRVLEDKGIAYKTSSGIYFDTQSSLYKYEKLVPSISDVESQSRLAQDPEKRHPRDFALWKRADDIDYSWDSPWGRGRPGWHIECSVNCHSLFGDHLDVHAGGIDLRFPHHCNEIAQCEAYSGGGGGAWCDMMLHIGHIFIEGRKMSKSLKNFITIDQLLQTYSANDFRMFCMLNHYSARIQLDDNGLVEAQRQWKALEASIHRIQTELSKGSRFGDSDSRVVRRWLEKWNETKTKIDESLANDSNTRQVVSETQNLLHEIEKCLLENRQALAGRVASLIANEMIDLYTDLGFVFDAKPTEMRDKEMIDALCEFRSAVRTICLKDTHSEVSREVLQACDALRQSASDRFGITIIDGKSDVRWVVGPLPKKQPKKAKQEGLNPSVPPSEMFLGNSEFSAFDKEGIPTHDKDGKPLSASRLKKLRKQYATHSLIHSKWLEQKKRCVCLLVDTTR